MPHSGIVSHANIQRELFVSRWHADCLSLPPLLSLSLSLSLSFRPPSLNPCSGKGCEILTDSPVFLERQKLARVSLFNACIRFSGKFVTRRISFDPFFFLFFSIDRINCSDEFFGRIDTKDKKQLQLKIFPVIITNNTSRRSTKHVETRT